MNRRHFLWSIAACMAPSVASADTEDWRQALREAIAEGTPLTLGHKMPPPDDPAWNEVDAIMANAPRSTTPFEIASYFVTSIPAKYQHAWPEPDPKHPTFANPLIVRLFLATKTNPSGDVTPWCAAFVNWCLDRAGISGTGDARSQSFATWGSPAWQKGQGDMPVSARQGDIAVFRLQSDPRQGHVAFFGAISPTQPRRIEVLGGNQIADARGQRLHLIDTTTFRIDGDLELVAVRTTDRLRRG